MVPGNHRGTFNKTSGRLLRRSDLVSAGKICIVSSQDICTVSRQAICIVSSQGICIVSSQDVWIEDICIVSHLNDKTATRARLRRARVVVVEIEM